MLSNCAPRLEGNPICSKVKDTYCSNKKKKTSTVLIAVIVPVVLVSLLVVMGILWKFYWKGKTKLYALNFPFINAIGGRHKRAALYLNFHVKHNFLTLQGSQETMKIMLCMKRKLPYILISDGSHTQS